MKRSPSLLAQIILLITFILSFSMIYVSAHFSGMISEIMKESLGHQAMTVAKFVADDESIRGAFGNENPSEVIQPIAEKIRLQSGASYVVVGNRDGIRYSHHIIENIGKVMGTSNEPVFSREESVIYEGVGISGPAIKAKVPIYDLNGQLVGVSSVGYTINDIKLRTKQYQKEVMLLSIVLLIAGCGGAVLIARRVKRLIFGLEPEEISFLFKEKEAIIESIRDAIVAVDLNHRVVSMNRRAREMIHEQYLSMGQKIRHDRIEHILQEVMVKKQGKTNQNIMVGYQFYVMDLSPILQQDKLMGVVITIRAVSEIEQLTDEVSQIKTYSENMRAQNHEYLNRLNTIYGLMSLEEYDKAKEMISGEVKERQDVIAFLISSVKDPLIAACLLGKINSAKERKVQLNIDMESKLIDIPSDINTQLIVTIIGNIIDNAMDATRKLRGDGAIVEVSFTDLGPDLIFDIDDNGNGVPENLHKIIFIDGYTTKLGENHGLGLAIVNNNLSLLQGSIQIGRSEFGGARFTIIIPKFVEGRGDQDE
jgi:two-component system, CitB family, sensor kinase